LVRRASVWMLRKAMGTPEACEARNQALARASVSSTEL
jgi:hypothetical protein